MNAFEPYSLGTLTLKNRIVMAPMTRCRAIDNIPNDLMAEYYSQRAGAGLIISEGTSPSINGVGYARIPGAYTPAQINGWKEIAQSVHAKDGVFFVQLMHCGRIAAKQNLPEGGEVVGPSAVQAEGEMYTDSDGMVKHETPRAMTLQDIDQCKKEFVNASQELVRSGIDGIELHAANGYLLDQFLNPRSNLRKDDYGGDFKSRARLVVELVSEVSGAIGGDKVGIRFSPYGAMNDMEYDYEDLVDMYSYLAKELRKIGIAYIHIVNHTGTMGAPDFKTDIIKTIKLNFNGTIISGGDVGGKQDLKNLLQGPIDLVYIGRPFISNPDLVKKIKEGEELVQPDPDLFYTPGPEGYTDY
jgi:N-ethylmaleimide reductase